MTPTFFSTLGITDTNAINAIKNLGVTLASVAVGGTTGAAAAFNADANNRQLHPNEKERIRQLAGSDKELEARLAAAACYLVHCSAEIPAGTSAYEAFLSMERVGATLKYEIGLLQSQSDRFGRMFTYSYVDATLDVLKRANSEYSILARLGGAAQAAVGGTAVAFGGSTVASGAASCAPTAGAGCLAALGGGMLVLWGQDQYRAGTLAMASGQPKHTFGALLLSDWTGISVDAAELWYAIPGVVVGSGSVAVSAESKRLAELARIARPSYSAFVPKGLQATDDVLASPQAQSLIAELRAAGSSADRAVDLAKGMIQSGSTMISEGIATQGATLYKISPKGVEPSVYTPFWMSAQEAQAVARMAPEQAAKYLGLPLESLGAALQAGGFEYFSISVKQGQTAKVFMSKIAPTYQGGFTTAGGGYTGPSARAGCGIDAMDDTCQG